MAAGVSPTTLGSLHAPGSSGSDSESEGAASASSAFDVFEPVAKHLARVVARMEHCEPGILRATPAYKVLASCAAALRETDQDLYFHSVPVQQIEEFWSHSWHGSKYLKVLLLLLIYNGPAAVVFASLSALVMLALQLADLLPGIERETRGNLDPGSTVLFAPWCTLAGGIVSVLLLFMWKSGRMVFFDQICINQFDPELKFKGLVSLGAILKRSKSFLLVWDTTFASRLWCVLELAAFLTNRENAEVNLRIWPTAVAPSILVIAFGNWLVMLAWILFYNPRAEVDVLVLVGLRWVSLCVGISYLRAHYRNTEVMLKQLSFFKVSSTTCQCCSLGHRNPDGSKFMCDRGIICGCVQIWYGSEENFEAMVRNRVRIILYRQLGGLLFPYRWLLTASITFLWAFMDLAAARGRAGKWVEAGYLLWAGLVWCLFTTPFLLQTTLFLANFFRSRASRQWQDQLKTCLVAFLIAVLSTLATRMERLVSDVFSSSLRTAVSVLLFGITWTAARYHARQMEVELASMTRDPAVGPMGSAAGDSTM